MIFQLPNPIPITVRDPEDMGAFFKKYGIIPYYGTDEYTSHSFLDLLTTITSLSPTFNMVERDLKEYVFGQNIDFVGRAIPGLAADTEELPFEAKVEFANFLGDLNITLPSIRKLSKRMKHHLDVCGNSYLKIKRVQVGDSVRYFLSVPHYEHVAYLHSYDPGERFLIISKFLGDDQKMSKYPPMILLATQAGDEINWTTTDKGEEQAIIHIKVDSDQDESDYYARPDILASLTWLYTDFQLGNLNSKIAATELITKKILAFEAPDPNSIFDEGDELSELDESGDIGKKKMSAFQRNMLVLKELTSNLGSHPSNLVGPKTGSIVGVQYPHGGNQPTAIDIEMNRDTKHQEWQSNKATAVICGVMGWAPELIGMRAAASTLGGNLLYDMFTIKNMSTIQPEKNFFQDMWNDVISQICFREGGQDEFKNYGIQFPDVIEEMVGKLKDTKDFSNETDPALAVNETETDEQ